MNIPEGTLEVSIRSSLDGSMQPSLLYRASSKNRPLIVVLHTWSRDRFNQINNFLPFGKKYDINLLFPEFRGPNLIGNPNGMDACCSNLAIQDIFDSAEYFKAEFGCDEQNVYLTGASGGGLMALMTCSRDPLYFRAVQAIVPITDLEKWHAENENYRPHIEYCMGGAPNEKTRAEYRKRSPISHVPSLANATLRICSGKTDPVVHYSHGLSLYNEIVKYDPCSKTYLEVFDGGHQQNIENAFMWIYGQITQQQLSTVTG